MAENGGRLLAALEKSVTSFEAMADLGTFEEKRKALLRKCDHAYAVAEAGRGYKDNKGREHSNPDAGGMVRCIELAARLLGVLAEAEKRAKDGDGDTRTADIEQVASLLRSVGYEVTKKAA